MFERSPFFPAAERDELTALEIELIPSPRNNRRKGWIGA
jgi:hypothetical protein